MEQIGLRERNEEFKYPSVLPPQRQQRPDADRGNWFSRTFTQPGDLGAERIRRERLQNDLTEYNRDLKKAWSDIGQAKASMMSGNLKQAVTYAGKVDDVFPDGGKIEGVVSPADEASQRIATEGDVTEVIKVRESDGNYTYYPLNEDSVNEILTKGMAALNPKEFIKTRVMLKAQIEEDNADQVSHPIKFKDGRITFYQRDLKTGEKETYSYKTKEDYLQAHPEKLIDYRTPESEKEALETRKTEADIKRKGYIASPRGIVDTRGKGGPSVIKGTEPEKKTVGYTKEGHPVKEGEEAGPVYRKGLTRPSESAKTKTVNPSNMVKNEDGQWGWYTEDGTFHEAKGLDDEVMKLKKKKGDITEKDILTIKQKILSEYNKLQLAKEKGEITTEVPPWERYYNDAIKKILPKDRLPKSALSGNPQYSEKHKAWFDKDQYGTFHRVPAPKGKEEGAKVTPASGLRGEILTKKIEKPKEGIKEPGTKKKKKKKKKKKR